MDVKHTKRQIMELGESLIQIYGYNEFSYRMIATKLGIKNAAIHYHFQKKVDLGCAIIERYRKRFQLWIGNNRIKTLSPTEKIEWFISIYTSYHADNANVCLAGSLENEFESLPEELKTQTQLLTKELLAWLEDTLGEGAQRGYFDFRGDIVDRAHMVLSGLQGALLVSRAKDIEAYKAVVRTIMKDLQRL